MVIGLNVFRIDSRFSSRQSTKTVSSIQVDALMIKGLFMKLNLAGFWHPAFYRAIRDRDVCFSRLLLNTPCKIGPPTGHRDCFSYERVDMWTFRCSYRILAKRENCFALRSPHPPFINVSEKQHRFGGNNPRSD